MHIPIPTTAFIRRVEAWAKRTVVYSGFVLIATTFGYIGLVLLGIPAMAQQIGYLAIILCAAMIQVGAVLFLVSLIFRVYEGALRMVEGRRILKPKRKKQR